jgi:DnaJ-class molecular chaperone
MLHLLWFYIALIWFRIRDLCPLCAVTGQSFFHKIRCPCPACHGKGHWSGLEALK